VLHLGSGSGRLSLLMMAGLMGGGLPDVPDDDRTPIWKMHKGYRPYHQALLDGTWCYWADERAMLAPIDDRWQDRIDEQEAKRKEAVHQEWKRKQAEDEARREALKKEQNLAFFDKYDRWPWEPDPEKEQRRLDKVAQMQLEEEQRKMAARALRAKNKTSRRNANRAKARQRRRAEKRSEKDAT